MLHDDAVGHVNCDGDNSCNGADTGANGYGDNNDCGVRIRAAKNSVVNLKFDRELPLTLSNPISTLANAILCPHSAATPPALLSSALLKSARDSSAAQNAESTKTAFTIPPQSSTSRVVRTASAAARSTAQPAATTSRSTTAGARPPLCSAT